MSLESLITPEILNDDFHQIIYTIAATQPLRHILEIGSSSGQGSTDGWVRGIMQNIHKPTLHCIEVSRTRYSKLEEFYRGNQQVRCYCASSIPVSDFPDEEEVIKFYKTKETKLRQFPLEQVLSWLRDDINYVQKNKIAEDGIKQALQSTGGTKFDAVLIDGSEFTGVAEFAQIYGANFILLDDIETFKNCETFHYLKGDPSYECLYVNHTLRNGCAVFRKR